MRVFLGVFLFVLATVASNVLAGVPPRVDPNQLAANGKFAGTVRLLSAKAKIDPKEAGEVCGVTYTAKILQSVKGGEAGDIVTLHMVKDIRGFQQLNFLNVGSDYFIYAEHRDTLRLINLSDVLYPTHKYHKRCYGPNRGLHLFREFSGEIRTEKGIDYVNIPALSQIADASALPAAYWPAKGGEMIFGVVSLQKRMTEELHRQGFILKDVLTFMRDILVD